MSGPVRFSDCIESLENARGTCLELLDKDSSKLTVITIINAEKRLDEQEVYLKKLNNQVSSVYFPSCLLNEVESLMDSSKKVLDQILVWSEGAAYLSELCDKVVRNSHLHDAIMAVVREKLNLDRAEVESLPDTVIVGDSDDDSLADTVILDPSQDSDWDL